MHFLDSFFCWSVCLIHSTNVCGTPIVFRALFYIFLLEFMDSYHRICSLTVKGKKLHCYRGTLIPYHRRSNLLFLLENNYHAEAKIIFKALLCVCKHKAARHMSAVGSEHSKEKALKQQLLLLIPHKHTLNKARCSVVVSRISQWCLCQRTFFLTKWKKEIKCSGKTSDFFHLSADLPTKKQQLQALNLLVILLPDANRDTLKVSWLRLPSLSLRTKQTSFSWFVAKHDMIMEVLVVVSKEKTCF